MNKIYKITKTITAVDGKLQRCSIAKVNANNVFLSTESYTYDNDNKKWTPQSKLNRILNDRGDIVKTSSYDIWRDKIEHEINIISYEYDMDGRLLKSVATDDVGNLIYVSSYEYNESGSYIKSTHYCKNPNMCFDYITEIDESGLKTRENRYLNGKAIGTALYEYNSDGKIIKKTSFRDEKLEEENLFQYDDLGEQSSSIVKRYISDEIQTTEYDYQKETIMVDSSGEYIELEDSSFSFMELLNNDDNNDSDSLENESITENEMEKILRKAEQNDPEMMAYAAHGYYSGVDGFPRDDDLAFFWSKKAAVYAPDYGFAWEMLGRCYQFGVGTAEDISLAIDAYQKSAELGDVDGMYLLAEMYYFDATDDNKHLCVPWLEKASAQGDVRATTLLGALYKDGEYVAKDIEKGIALLKMAAEKGEAQAARLLAEFYSADQDTPGNTFLANKYWTMAVENGEDNPKALLYAGLAWFYGVGVKQNFEKSRQCLEQDEFDDEANAILGTMLFEGAGGPVDREEGERRLRKAINGRSEKFSLQAMNDLGMYLYNSSDRLLEAVQLFSKAADRGNANAQVNLGKAYYEGKGVPHSEARAMYYFRLAAKQGNEIAKENLRILDSSFSAWGGDMGENSGNRQYNNSATYNRQIGGGRKRHRVRGAIIGILIGCVVGLFAGLSDWHPFVQTIFVLAFMGVGILLG